MAIFFKKRNLEKSKQSVHEYIDMLDLKLKNAPFKTRMIHK